MHSLHSGLCGAEFRFMGAEERRTTETPRPRARIGSQGPRGFGRSRLSHSRAGPRKMPALEGSFPPFESNPGTPSWGSRSFLNKCCLALEIIPGHSRGKGRALRESWAARLLRRQSDSCRRIKHLVRDYRSGANRIAHGLPSSWWAGTCAVAMTCLNPDDIKHLC